LVLSQELFQDRLASDLIFCKLTIAKDSKLLPKKKWRVIAEL
jgi:hypothetical protein